MYDFGQDEVNVLTLFSSDHRGANVISSNHSRELAVDLHNLYFWKILSPALRN